MFLLLCNVFGEHTLWKSRPLPRLRIHYTRARPHLLAPTLKSFWGQVILRVCFVLRGMLKAEWLRLPLSEDSIDITSSPSQVQLCIKCQDALDHLYLRYTESTYEAEHYVLKDLLASAENGCRLCQLFTRSGITKSDESLKELLHRQEDDPGTLTIAETGSLMGRYPCYLSLTTYEHENVINHISIACISSEGMSSHCKSRFKRAFPACLILSEG